MERERILVGSRAFFDGIPDFKPHDSDWVEFYDTSEVSFQYKNVLKAGSDCVFQLVRRPKQQRIDYALAHERPFSLCMFLVPRICKEFGMDLHDLEMLRPMRENLNYRHLYLGIIFDAYMENGSMTLTDNQRTHAYIEYMKARNNH
jgi:hypothetical protein